MSEEALPPSPPLCPACRHPLPEGVVGSVPCPNCGRVSGDPEHLDSVPEHTPEERRLWKICFWALFFLTPVLPIAMGFALSMIPRILPGALPLRWPAQFGGSLLFVVPVLAGLTFGHTDDQLTLPLGAMATLDADKPELVIEESGVSPE